MDTYPRLRILILMNAELAILVGLLLRTVPVLLVGTVGFVLFSRSTLGKSLIRRLQEGGADAETLAAMQDELQELRRELGEVHERLDFAERRLVQQNKPPSRSDNPSPPTPVGAGHR